jgi:hypothetical protein
VPLELLVAIFFFRIRKQQASPSVIIGGKKIYFEREDSELLQCGEGSAERVWTNDSWPTEHTDHTEKGDHETDEIHEFKFW